MMCEAKDFCIHLVLKTCVWYNSTKLRRDENQKQTNKDAAININMANLNFLMCLIFYILIQNVNGITQ